MQHLRSCFLTPTKFGYVSAHINYRADSTTRMGASSSKTASFIAKCAQILHFNDTAWAKP